MAFHTDAVTLATLTPSALTLPRRATELAWVVPATSRVHTVLIAPAWAGDQIADDPSCLLRADMSPDRLVREGLTPEVAISAFLRAVSPCQRVYLDNAPSDTDLLADLFARAGRRLQRTALGHLVHGRQRFQPIDPAALRLAANTPGAHPCAPARDRLERRLIALSPPRRRRSPRRTG